MQHETCISGLMSKTKSSSSSASCLHSPVMPFARSFRVVLAILSHVPLGHISRPLNVALWEGNSALKWLKSPINLLCTSVWRGNELCPMWTSTGASRVVRVSNSFSDGGELSVQGGGYIAFGRYDLVESPAELASNLSDIETCADSRTGRGRDPNSTNIWVIRVCDYDFNYLCRNSTSHTA